MNNDHMSKKIVVISGGFGYVGLEVAKALSEEGYLLTLLYNTTSQSDIDDGLQKLTGTGHAAYACDLSNEKSVEEVIERIEKEQGLIFMAVHAAGKKPERKKLHQTTTEELRLQIDTNIVGSFNFLTTCGKKLKDRKEGLIIGITTIGVVVPEATRSLGAYIPAKYAVQGMLTMLRDELAPHNVSVYSIAPGFMPDGMNKDIPQAFIQMIESKTPDKQLANASMIASKIVELSKKNVNQESLTITIAPEYRI